MGQPTRVLVAIRRTGPTPGAVEVTLLTTRQGAATTVDPLLSEVVVLQSGSLTTGPGRLPSQVATLLRRRKKCSAPTWSVLASLRASRGTRKGPTPSSSRSKSGG